MGYYAINDDNAFQLLRHWSQETNTKLRRIAELLTESAATGEGSGLAPHQIVQLVYLRWRNSIATAIDPTLSG